jgi:hypothetical protein
MAAACLKVDALPREFVKRLGADLSAVAFSSERCFAGEAIHGRQTRIRRYDQRGNAAATAPRHAARDQASRQGDLPSQPLAARALGAVATGNADAVEAQALEDQGLDLRRSIAIGLS